MFLPKSKNLFEPEFQKMVPIEQLTVADLSDMVGRDPEGASLEFKVDIPLHSQSRKEQLSRGTQIPRDPWWLGKGIAAHGRDELLSEIIAFANATGGRLVVGMDEDEVTTVASAIVPLPRIKDLEARFADCMLSCIEPRLPQFCVRGVEIGDAGEGVLVVDIQPSRLGPHRVANTLAVTVRRGDRCMPMTMGEVHEMVLRNVRRFDEVKSVLDLRIAALDGALQQFLISKVSSHVVGGTTADRISAWLKMENSSAIAFKVVVCAHEDLGLSRLTSFDPLVPNKRCVAEITAQGPVTHRDMVGLWPEIGHSQRFLGGVRQSSAWDSGIYMRSRSGGRSGTMLLSRWQSS